MGWKRLLIIGLVVIGVLLGMDLAIDPLNRFAVRLEVTELVSKNWQSGFWTPIDLPKGATAQNLVDRLAGGDLYEVIETKEIWTPKTATPSRVFAALVSSNGGKKICLFHYQSWTDSWQGRIYDL